MPFEQIPCSQILRRSLLRICHVCPWTRTCLLRVKAISEASGSSISAYFEAKTGKKFLFSGKGVTRMISEPPLTQNLKGGRSFNYGKSVKAVFRIVEELDLGVKGTFRTVAEYARAIKGTFLASSVQRICAKSIFVPSENSVIA